MYLNKFIFNLEMASFMAKGRILVIGIGAMGSAFLENIKSKDLDEIGIFDGDIITESNLFNQPFYSGYYRSKAQSKVEFALDKLGKTSKNTKYTGYDRYFGKRDAGILKDYDLILDFTDNIKSRTIINYACIKAKKPAIYSSINEREGTVYFYGDGSACFNCILRNSIGKIKEGCESHTAIPTKDFIDFITQSVDDFFKDKAEFGKLSVFDFSKAGRFSLNIKKDSDCEACSKDSLVIDDDEFIQICSSGIKFSAGKELDLGNLAGYLKGSRLTEEYLIVDNGGRTAFISRQGDFLLTGYNKDEARELLSSILAYDSKKKNQA